MRMMLKVGIPTEAGNRGIKDGTLPKLLGAAFENLRPEAAYFGLEGGKRTAWLFFDLASPSDMPVIGEPLFMGVGAELELVPVCTRDDLEKGLDAARRAM